jgi:hypothetical protein
LSLPKKYLRVVTQLATSGALGAALMLGSAAPSAADQEAVVREPVSGQAAGVAERLAAIREAVSIVAVTQAAEQRLAWGNWWRNGPWAWGRRPWGWGNGGPWGNWRNGWNNWGNWFRNW